MDRFGLRVALVQLAECMDKKKNISAAVEQIHKAKYNGAQLVALPEFFNAPSTKSVPDGESCRALQRAAMEAGVCVVGERSGDDLYNTPSGTTAGTLSRSIERSENGRSSQSNTSEKSKKNRYLRHGQSPRRVVIVIEQSSFIRLSIAIQRGNAASLLDTLPADSVEDEFFDAIF